MPQLALAAAAAVTYVSGAVASAGAFIATSLSVYTGISIGTAMAITSAAGTLALNAGLAAASSALMQPRTGAGGSPTAFKADPAAPISGVMGEFGVAGRQQHANVWGKGNLYLSFATALSLGPIQSIDSFRANDQLVSFPGAQGLAAGVEPYKDKMWMTYKLGLPTDGALGPPTGVSDGSPSMSEWGAAHKSSGIAGSFWTLKNNSKRASYEGGVPRPLWKLKGMKLWDPRADSTYPGGSGSQRPNDWSTWTYTENPYLHALAWVRGHHKNVSGGTIDRTKRLAGVGAPDTAIDIAAFVDGANVADANGWVISGEWTTSDDKWQTLAAMLQAGGGTPLNRGAQISCMVSTPRASILTLTGENIVGAVSMSVMTSRRDRPNAIIPRYRSEVHKWEQVAAGAVTSSTYVTEDRGEPRTREVAYQFVRLAKQAAELAAYDLANARETLTASIPAKPHLLGLRAGDAFVVSAAETGLNGQKFILVKRSFDPSSAIVTLEVRSETDAKHAWALGQTENPPPTPSLTAVDPIPPAPDIEDWDIVARPPEAGGIQQPGVIVSENGAITATANVGAVLMEVGPAADGPWQQVYQGPPTTAEVPINGLKAGATYYVAITYYSLKGVPSERTVFGPYTAPGLIAGDTVNVGGVNSDLFVTRMVDVEALAADNADAVEDILAGYPSITDAVADAEAARDVSIVKAGEAGGSASASAGSASAAAASDSSASGHAAAAAGFAATANTKAGEAGAFSTAAAESRDDAQQASIESGTYASDASSAAATSTAQASVATDKAAEAEASAIVAANVYGAGSNQLKKSQFFNIGDMLPWAISTADLPSASAYVFTLNNTRAPVGEYPLVATAGVNGGTFTQFVSEHVPVIAGRRQCASVFTATSSCRSWIFVAGYDGAGQYVSDSGLLYSEQTALNEGEATTELADWKHIYSFYDPPAEVATVRVFLRRYQTETGDYSEAWFLRPMIAQVSATQTQPPFWSPPNTGSAVSVISTAVDDLNDQKDLARFQVATTTSGGAAVLSLLSTLYGTVAGITADQIWWGENTVFDNATDTLRTTSGGNVRVIALGASFGTDGQLTEWEGPSSVAFSAMSRANAYFYRANVAPFVYAVGVTSGLSATVSGDATGSAPGGGAIGTNSVTVTPSGGTGGTTIRWVNVSGDSTIYAGGETSFSTSFFATVPPGGTKTALFMGIVTRSGQTATVLVNVQLFDST